MEPTRTPTKTLTNLKRTKINIFLMRLLNETKIYSTHCILMELFAIHQREGRVGDGLGHAAHLAEHYDNKQNFSRASSLVVTN